MNRSPLHAWVLTSTTLGALLYVQSLAAQVIPDTTLPVGERTQVTGNPNFQIDGGARRGGNLFHSFQSFSIPTGGGAYFNNAADVQTIFTRITGGSVSSIDGVIRANARANLFLLNPNGILFGANARLNIGGSFVATTANSINFADNFQYSATASQTIPLLTVSVPVGLQMGTNSGSIVVQGNGSDLSIQDLASPVTKNSGFTGLQVPLGKTLALVGGDVELAGGTLTAEQGHIELGSLASGQVTLTPILEGFALSYPSGQRFGDIRLSKQALVDASGGGSIQVQGNDVSLTDGSIILIQNQGAQQGGYIRVQAASTLKLRGDSPQQPFVFSSLRSETTGSSSGASIAVFTPMLVIQEAAGIAVYSFSSGKGGNVTVAASNEVQLSGVSPPGIDQNSSIFTGATGSGTGGDITLSTRRLIVDSGASIYTATRGTGDAGDIVVNADSVEITGGSRFTLSNLASGTGATGDAGKLIVNTQRLTLRDGGAILTSTFDAGSAGSLTINASESVEVTGRALLTIPVPSQISSSGFLYPYPGRTLTGAAGDVTIITGQLSVTDGAKIDVSNQGTGNAGTLRVFANSTSLDRGGTITAATASGEGGNIDLNVRDTLLLRNNSPITSSADGTGNGGNITINTSSLVAIPNENSDIRADSVNARGGNVTINAAGIFGTQFSPQDTPLSDITATGANSALNGTVQLNIERPNPTSGLVELPATVVDSSRLIAQGCPANQGNSFVVTGRGGLPPTPEQQLDDDAAWLDRRRLTVAQHSPQPTANTPTPKSSKPTAHGPIIEATGWQITPTGKVILVATTPDPTVQHPLNQPVACPSR